MRREVVPFVDVGRSALALLVTMTFLLFSVGGALGGWDVEVLPVEASAMGPDALAFDPQGFPAIAYQAGSGLYFVRWQESGWWSEYIAPGGIRTSLEYDGLGNPGIAFGWQGSGDRSVGFAYKAGDGWTVCNVWWGLTGDEGCLAFSGEDRATVAGYCLGDQVCAVDTGAVCSEPWLRYPFEGGGGTSVAYLPNGSPIVAYVASEVLRVAEGPPSWIYATVDADSVFGDAFLQVGPSGDPAVVYASGAGGGRILMATRSGLGWTIDTVSSEFGTSVSLAFDGGGSPMVSYISSAGILRFCSLERAAWSVEDIPSSSVTSACLASDASGRPGLAFREASGVLCYARRHDLTGSVDASSHVGGDVPVFSISPSPSVGSVRVLFTRTRDAGRVPLRVEIFEAAGRLVAVLAGARLDAGEREVVWDGRDDHGREVPSGTYFARLHAGEYVAVRKMVLLR